MGRAGDLRNPSDIARFSGDESVELLRALLDSLGDRKKELLSEACRTAPVGEFARVATERFGSDAFEAWLRAFRKRDGNGCSAILESADDGGNQ